MTRVVVTGGGGLTGDHLVETLIARGDEVTVFDSRPPNQVTHEQVAFVAGDITDETAVTEVILPETELVIHLTEHPAALDEGSRNILVRATEMGARVVVGSTNPGQRSSAAMTEHLTYATFRKQGLRATVVHFAGARPADAVSATLLAATTDAAVGQTFTIGGTAEDNAKARDILGWRPTRAEVPESGAA